MYKFWLPLALGAGLLACGTPDAPRAPKDAGDVDTGSDDDEDFDETGPSTRPTRMDGGRPDSGARDSGRNDGGRTSVPRNDGGMTLTPPNADRTPAGDGRTPPTSTPPTSTPPTSTPSGGVTPPSGGGNPNPNPNPTPTPPANGGDPTPPAGGGEPTPPPSGGAPAQSGGGLGGGCGGDSDCGGGGLRCITNVPAPEGFDLTATFPGGYCTRECGNDGECGGNAGCPLAALAPFSAQFSQCAVYCGSDAECRAGYVCKTLPPLGDAPVNPNKTCQPTQPFGPMGPTVEQIADLIGAAL